VNAIRSGVDYKSVSDSMGHYSAAFTMDVYATTTPDMEKEASVKMDAFIQRLNWK
jgi:integrase